MVMEIGTFGFRSSDRVASATDRPDSRYEFGLRALVVNRITDHNYRREIRLRDDTR